MAAVHDGAMAKETYTLEDLESRQRLDCGHETAARLAVIGHPIAHSASPRMHQPALDAARINLRYIRIDVEPGQLAAAFKQMQELGFVGCNVTVPHKLDAMNACDVLDPSAIALGAVNTIQFTDRGMLGANTDGPGFAQAMLHDFDLPLAGKSVAIVGAGGGAGQAIAAQCALEKVQTLVLINRTLEKLEPLAARIRELHPSINIQSFAADDDALVQQVQACELVVNMSSLGLRPEDDTPLPSACFHEGQCVYDAIYQPEKTRMLELAEQRGARISNGLSMLIHQGALAFKHWFPDAPDPLAVMEDALRGTSS